jgi:hypothetical protein
MGNEAIMLAMEEEALSRSWRRIAYKLRGEVLSFTTRSGRQFRALLVDSAEDGFLLFDPTDGEPVVRLEPFPAVAGVTPVRDAEVDEIRAAYLRSPAAA